MPISRDTQASDLGFCEPETTVMGHNQHSPRPFQRRLHHDRLPTRHARPTGPSRRHIRDGCIWRQLAPTACRAHGCCWESSLASVREELPCPSVGSAVSAPGLLSEDSPVHAATPCSPDTPTHEAPRLTNGLLKPVRPVPCPSPTGHALQNPVSTISEGRFSSRSVRSFDPPSEVIANRVFIGSFFAACDADTFADVKAEHIEFPRYQSHSRTGIACCRFGHIQAILRVGRHELLSLLPIELHRCLSEVHSIDKFQDLKCGMSIQCNQRSNMPLVQHIPFFIGSTMPEWLGHLYRLPQNAQVRLV